MAVMTGFGMYWKLRPPCTQPRCSKRTHTGTTAGRLPPGTVQAMLASERLREEWQACQHRPASRHHRCPSSHGPEPPTRQPPPHTDTISTFPLPHLRSGRPPHPGHLPFSLTLPPPTSSKKPPQRYPPGFHPCKSSNPYSPESPPPNPNPTGCS